MNGSGHNIRLTKKKRLNKPLTVILCVLAAVLSVLFIIGMTVGRDSEDINKTSAAVKENTELKQQISAKEDEIKRLNEKVDELEKKLAQTPTPAPTPTPDADDYDEDYYDYDEDYDSDSLSPREGY